MALQVAVLQEVKQKLTGLFVENSDRKRFIPLRSLDALFSEPVVRQCIAESGIRADKREEVTANIIRGGKRVFAILIRIDSVPSINDFLEHDQFMRRPLDARLPFSENELRSILNDYSSREFFWHQWEVSVPTFTADLSHRSLHDNTIFPFTSSECIGEGGFGRVFQITLDEGSQGGFHYPQLTIGSVIVRKEVAIPKNGSPNRPTTHEGDILSLLRMLKHPCISQLLASYTYQNTYNLLFPRADCDLAQMLELRGGHRDFSHPFDFYRALHGLCSALAAVHEFFNPETGLKLKGYHHDLKPENILVHQGRFILSDFGLSNLKTLSQRTQTQFKHASGYYVAPESPRIEDNFNPTEVGQPSDIWALGCILVVVLTYIKDGAEGVQEFEKRREFVVNGWTTWQFYAGRDVSPAVLAWIQYLSDSTSPEGKATLDLANDMLLIRPSERPTATHVSARMEFLAVKSLYSMTLGLFKEAKAQQDHFCISMEYERFEKYGEFIHISAADKQWPPVPELSPAADSSDVVQETLLNLRESLESMGGAIASAFAAPAYRRIQQLVDKLWSGLSPDARAALYRAVERQFLSTNNLKISNLPPMESMKVSGYQHLGIRIVIKQMIDSLKDKSFRRDFLLEPPNLQQLAVDRIQKYRLQTFQPFKIKLNGANAWQDVIVEWLAYTDGLGKMEIAELIVRVDGLAEMLNYKHRPEAFRCLRCIGYYHEPLRHAFSFVFEIPPGSYPIPLVALLRGGGTEGELKQRTGHETPSLTQKFKLAQSLAASVLEWHKVGWMHRGLSSSNVILLENVGQSPSMSLSEPFIMGFSRSRPEEQTNFTMGPTEDPNQRRYCHPHYIMSGRHRVEHDYYSLGLVLLEIGHWRALKTMMREDKNRGLDEERERILNKYVKVELDQKMGCVYRSVVEDCLSMHILDEPGSELASVIKFEDDILKRLESCYV
ncbi:hypothetical protein ABW20_dc0100546 [Dactylellina cionopaga]|nr:hypothetical protein ABW20_dc0100546 [Dactylellina cionopaga]